MNKRIKIYGERNTNTNYLSRLIDLNLEVAQFPGSVPDWVRRKQESLPGSEWINDLYFYLTYRKNLGWKHGQARPVDTLRRVSRLYNNEVAIVTLTKNPYSWLLSLFRNPYHHFGPKEYDFETFLSSRWRTTFRDNTRRTLQSPVELWNIKNNSYLGLAAMGALNLKTEAIFQDAPAAIDLISRYFFIEKKEQDFVDFPQSTKRGGSTGDAYRDYYCNEKWRAELSAEAVELINNRVDMDVMSHFGYKPLSVR